MDTGNFNKPMLTEPGVKYFLNATLKQCHQFREKYMNTMLNICLFVGFSLSIAFSKSNCDFNNSISDETLFLELIFSTSIICLA